MTKQHNPPIDKALPAVKEVLLENNLPFEIKNKGYHIIIRTQDHRYDFWPTSGKWMIDKDFVFRYGGLTKLIDKVLDDNFESVDSDYDKIFETDFDDKTTGELKDTIKFLCDYINKNLKAK